MRIDFFGNGVILYYTVKFKFKQDIITGQYWLIDLAVPD